MAAARVSIRTASRNFRLAWGTTRTTINRRGWPGLQRRAYASSGEGGSSTHKASSDLPWAITSIVVTVPATWYLLQPQIERYKKGKDGHEHHERHIEISHVDPPEPAEEEKPAETTAESEEGAGEEAKEEQPKEGDDAGKESSSEEEDNKDVPKPEELKDDKESSGGSDEQSSEESNEKESPAPVTGAKHSTDPVSDPDKSKKGEGVAETMRISGTVDPGRPAR